MPYVNRIDVSKCANAKGVAKTDPHHPCDPPLPCNPFQEDDGDCPRPYLCLERIKNPAIGNTKCMEGQYMNVKSCKKAGEFDSSDSDPWHPCDPLLPCDTKKKKRPCQEPSLCLHKIKNPFVPKQPIIPTDCDPTLP